MKHEGTIMFAALTLLSLLLPQIAMARIWTVEKDGSGDFTVIQDALDAASPGDEVRIGPGRFDEMTRWDLLVNGAGSAGVMWVTTPNLTIVGAGPESTIVGPASYVGLYQDEDTVCLSVDTATDCEIRGIWFENTRFEVNFYASTIMEDCKITRSAFRTDMSLAMYECSGVEIRRVEFIDSGGINTLPGVSDLLIEDCTFEDSSDWTYAIQISNGTPNVTVRNCTITGGGSGIQYSGNGVVEDCVLEGQAGAGLEAVSGGQMIARRCHVGTTRTTVWVSNGSMEIHDSVLEGGTRETVVAGDSVLMRNCLILNAGGLSINGRSNDPGDFVDVRHNWWGTSDRAQIETWIYDKYGTVLWEPYNDQPIPTDSSSVSELKGKFGRR